MVWFKCDWSFNYFFQWREFIKTEHSLFHILTVFLAHDSDIFWDLFKESVHYQGYNIAALPYVFKQHIFNKFFLNVKVIRWSVFFSLRFHGCICCKLVINYGYDLFALLMWVICIKEYLYQNDQKPKNYSRLIIDNVTCWSNKKILSNGKFKPSSLVWTNQILRCLKYDKYIHHIIIYHYVYGKRKKIQCM